MNLLRVAKWDFIFNIMTFVYPCFVLSPCFILSVFFLLNRTKTPAFEFVALQKVPSHSGKFVLRTCYVCDPVALYFLGRMRSSRKVIRHVDKNCCRAAFINWRPAFLNVLYRPHVPLHKGPSNLPHLEKIRL